MTEKIELHDLFAQIDDTTQLNTQGIREERIKAAVLDKIQPPQTERIRRGRPSRRWFAALIAAACALVLSMGVCALTGGLFGVRLLDDSQRQALQTPRYAVIAGSRLPETGDDERLLTGYSAQILDEEYLAENELIFFDSVGTITGETEDGQTAFPEFIFENGDTAILTQPQGEGWQLQQGDTITVTFRQNIQDNPNAFPQGNKLSLGVILDGIPQDLWQGSDTSFTFCYTAPRAGTFYFYLQDLSSEPVIITDAAVTLEQP